MNGTLIQFFHWYLPGNGFLYRKLQREAPRLADIGITSVWLPPAYKADSGADSVGYDCYDLYDLGEFEQKGTTATKYGTKEEYLKAIKTLKDNGLRVMADIVLNHKAGGDELETFMVVQVDEDDRTKVITEPFEISSYTKFTFPGRGEQYSAFKWDFNCFVGVDYDEGGREGIFRILNEYGDDWDHMVSDEKGNYDFLMFNDIEHRNPYVLDELDRWAKWYHDTIGFDSVRLDAVKHISPQFFCRWLGNLREATGEEIFAVGEYWAPGRLSVLTDYLEATEGCMSLFDSSLQANFHFASKSKDYDLRLILKDSLVSVAPDKAVTLVSNHDTQPLQALEATVDPWFKPIAYTIILLRRDGYPCVFYPDLYGTEYTDTGSDGDEYDISMPPIEGLETLIRLRKDYAYGEQRDYFDEAHCIGWTRSGDDEHDGCAVVISNQSPSGRRMEIGQRYAGRKFRDAMEKHELLVTVEDDGWADFPAPAESVSVWIPAENND